MAGNSAGTVVQNGRNERAEIMRNNVKKMAVKAGVFVAAACLYATPAFAEKHNHKGHNHKENESDIIIDHAGNIVKLPDEINRIAVTDTLPLPSVLSLFLGSADQIVGISPASMSAAKSGLLGELYPEILDANTDFFSNNELNIEALMALEPDIVFYNAGNAAIEESLKSAGLTGIAVSVTKWDYDAAKTYEEWLDLLDDIFPERENVSERAEDYLDEVEELISEREKDIKKEDRKKVFYLFNYSDAGIITSGEKFWGQFWADAAGAINVSKEVPAEKSNAVVNMEQIYSWDPDIIFITNFTNAIPADLYENNIGDYDWSGIRAVENEQVYKMPMGAYRSFTPGVDTPMTMLWLAKQIYPELFADIDMVKEIETYYESVYDVKLSTEQIENMGIE